MKLWAVSFPLVSFLVGAAVAACASSSTPTSGGVPSSQVAYEYPGCSNYNKECPRLGTLHCALWAIAKKYNACSHHDECVEAAIEPKCSGEGTCPPFFVSRHWKTAFEEEAQGEINRYCESGTCSLPGLCPVPGTVHGYCASFGCTWIRASP